MNKVLIKKYKNLIKDNTNDSLTVYCKLRKIDDKLTLRKYVEYENKFSAKN